MALVGVTADAPALSEAEHDFDRYLRTNPTMSRSLRRPWTSS